MDQKKSIAAQTNDPQKEAFQFVKLTQDLQELQSNHSYLKTPFHNRYDQVKTLSQEFPTYLDYDGACGGLVRLQYAYQLNLTELSENGRIQYINPNGQSETFESMERLTAIDYGALAQKALNLKLITIAIDFTKEGVFLKLSLSRGFRTRLSTRAIEHESIHSCSHVFFNTLFPFQE